MCTIWTCSTHIIQVHKVYGVMSSTCILLPPFPLSLFIYIYIYKLSVSLYLYICLTLCYLYVYIRVSLFILYILLFGLLVCNIFYPCKFHVCFFKRKLRQEKLFRICIATDITLCKTTTTTKKKQNKKKKHKTLTLGRARRPCTFSLQ